MASIFRTQLPVIRPCLETVQHTGNLPCTLGARMTSTGLCPSNLAQFGLPNSENYGSIGSPLKRRAGKFAKSSTAQPRIEQMCLHLIRRMRL